MARKPLDRWWKIKDDGKKIMGRVMTVAQNVLKWGTGGINIDESRVESKPRLTGTLDKGEEIKAEPTSFKGSGTRKLQTGYDEKMLESNLGRFPANLIHDNSEEVRECFPETGKGNGKGAYNYAGREYNNKETSMFNGDKPQAPSNFNDSGNASRFFKSIIYQAKASKSERNKGCEGLEEKLDRPFEERLLAQCKICGNKGLKVGAGKQFTCGHTEIEYVKTEYKPSSNNHPTVKPIALMEYLIKMVTPKGGIVLDPFA
jgi:site-specific DNA-methyltransferase (adenine-specific)